MHKPINTGKVVKNELVQHFLVWAKNWYGTTGDSLRDILILTSMVYECDITTDECGVRMDINNLWRSIAEEGIYLGGFLDGLNYSGVFATMAITPQDIIRGLRNCCGPQFGKHDNWKPPVLYVKNFLNHMSTCQLCSDEYEKNVTLSLKYDKFKTVSLNADGFCRKETCGFHKFKQWELQGLEGHARQKELTPFSKFDEEIESNSQ